jgi:TRAP-type uncharacterized transport system substrate-binding protein
MCRVMRRMGLSGCAWLLAISLLSMSPFVPLPAGGPARAQSVPSSLQETAHESSVRDQRNAWTVGIVGGLYEGTFMRFADEMAKVLNDGENMRVLPIVSLGAASNLDDLLYLRGVDVAVTQADVFEYFRTHRKIANLDKRVNYILRLPASELHLIARPEIRTIEDLRGKKVHFGSPGAAGSLTGAIVFQRLGIQVQQVEDTNPNALRKLQTGEIDAVVRVVGKPVGYVSQLPAGSGLHILPIPFSKTFADYYSLGEFTDKDYPNLVPQGQRIDTLSVPGVLAVFNWPANHDRYRRVERFVQRMFANWDQFQHPPYHPKWRDINLAATVPGWSRFPVAEAELKKLVASGGDQRTRRDFEAFVSALNTRQGAPRSPAEEEELFRKFIEWQKQRR